LKEAGHSQWLVPREEMVNVRGKGILQTFFVEIKAGSRTSDTASEISADDITKSGSNKIDRLVSWNVEVLSGLLKCIVARREAMHKRHRKVDTKAVKGGMVLDEVVEIITLPEYNANAVFKQVDSSTVQLDSEVMAQLTSLVRRIASMYKA
jgi:hypothetical protein